MTRLQLIDKLAVLALIPTILFGVDLSAYRGFQFGMSLSAALKHSGVDVSEVMTLHEAPARIEELD